MEFLIIFSIALPVLAGVCLTLSKIENRREVHNYSAVVLAVTFVATAINNTLNFGKDCTLLALPMGLSLNFKVDTMAAFFSSIFTFVWLVVGIYTRDYLRHAGKDKRFVNFYLIALGCMNGVAYAHNPFTFYTSFEAMSLTSFALVLHDQTKESIAAAKKYIYYSIFGALCGLIGIMSFYGSDVIAVKEFVPGGSLAASAESMPMVLVVVFIAILGFSCKAGLFPMHAWLPIAHPEAPAPASAVLSGLIAKTGIVAIIRIIFYAVGPDALRGTWVHFAFLTLSIVTIFMGSMMAYKEKLLKRRLAYSSVSQISYAMFGVMMLNGVGMAGALLQIFFHAMAKTSLFLCSGAIIHQTHRTKVEQLTGLGKAMPKTFALFTIASLSLVGVPLTGGFESKFMLAQSALHGTYPILEFIGFVTIMVSALLTGGYLLSISSKALFTNKNEEVTQYCEASNEMIIPIAILVGLILVFGVWPVPASKVISSVITSMGI
ncbi:MAG: proton-conducting membrane transporter [Oscillospiraceae bacterium]|nr:proton-conducting membrane transporter [Oscillospiraceae bacterium]